MSNVHEPDFVDLHSPIDEVGIATHREAANRSPARRVTDVRILAYRVDDSLDCELHVACAARTSFIEVGKDFFVRSF